MADFSQGDTVRDYITVVDAGQQPVLGCTFTVVQTIDPDEDDFGLTIVEVGSGVYRVSFVAGKTGTYYWNIITATGPEFPQQFENTFVISPLLTFGVAIGVAATGVTLLDLVRMVATELGDFLEVVATAPSDASTFTDELRLAAISPSVLKGSALTVVAPSTSLNYGLNRRILDSSEDATLLTLKPPLPANISTGDVAWITNLHSRGFWLSQYASAINTVVVESFPGHAVPLSYTYPDVFSGADPAIPLPQQMTHVYAVRATNSEGTTQPVPLASWNTLGGPGWSFDASAGTIVIGDPYRCGMEGWQVTILGYGRAATLLNYSDVTTVDPEFIVNKAAASLRWSKGDQKRFPEAANFQSRSDLTMVKSFTMHEPNTIRVR
jgi:hypothetical protein